MGKNYFELKAEFIEFQERMAVVEGEELVELQNAYEQWQKENDIVGYCKLWGLSLYGMCPMCDKKECECKKENEVEEPENEE